jgi:Tfp pilus assembly protein PilP
VDLEQAFAYDVTPGPGNKLILTLHTQAAAPAVAPTVAKSAPATVPAKSSAPAPKPQTASAKPAAAPQAPTPTKTAAPAAKAQTAAAKNIPAPGPTIAFAKPQDAGKKPAAAAPVAAAKVEAPKPATKPGAPATTKIAAKDTEKPAVASKTAEAPKPPKAEEKKWAMSGKRDPFFSPVVQQPTGSNCSTGKKCLDIGQINLRGVVKSESGFIAVVTNSLNKAYFLHENDPVFNGYVVRITGDSVVFQETVQDKLGKPLTREVVKRIFTPAV